MNDRVPIALRCSAVVFRDDAVLLCERRDAKGTWVLPGGTPLPGEGSAACARREVLEETGLRIDTDRIAFVLEATSPDRSQHLIEIVFLGSDCDRLAVPERREERLSPEFVALSALASLDLRPPIGGYLRGLAGTRSRSLGALPGTGAYLGNVWRPSGFPTHYAAPPAEDGAAPHGTQRNE
ncbi:MAG: NUDIX hydrolase [Actinomycetota bacterium]|nr:NUDIX hydrolase [Actinomycetota bacterium]